MGLNISMLINIHILSKRLNSTRIFLLTLHCSMYLHPAADTAKVSFPMEIAQHNDGRFAFPDDLQVLLNVQEQNLILNLTRNVYLSQELSVSGDDGIMHTLQVQHRSHYLVS